MRIGRTSTRAASATRGRGFMYAIGGVALLAAIAMLAVGYLAPRGIPGRSYYNIKAQFNNADNLTNSYQVRIGGRLVGQVLDPEVKDGKGVVRLQLTSDVKPLLSDTKLRVRPRSAVGVRFVELIPGTKGHPLAKNEMIPASQTSETVQLDEALNTFDANRRRKAQQLLSGLGEGFLSRGEDLNLTLRDAPSFLRHLGSVTTEINKTDGAPFRLVQQSQRAADAADPVRQTIATGFDPEARALDVFSNHEDGLRQTLDTAPVTLPSIRGGLAQTSPLLREVRGMAAELEPALRNSVPALRNTNGLLKGARPGLQTLPETFDLVTKAVPPTTQALNTALPVLPSAEHALTEPLPLIDSLAARNCDFNFFNDGWTSIMNNSTPNGNILRLNLVASQESIFGVTDKGSKALSGPIRTNAFPAPCTAGKEGGG